MSTNDIEKTLINLTAQFRKESGIASQQEVKMNASLQRHLSIDSLARAELFQRIEKKFNVSFPDSLLGSADTLEDIADYLRKDHSQVENKQQKQVFITEDRPTIDLTQVKSLLDLPLMYGESAPDKAHIYFQHEDGQEEIISYGLLLNSALKVAASLKALGLKEGETVAIMQPTHPAFFYTFFGVLYAGGIPVPIYPPFRMHMLETYAKIEAHILKSAQVRILITFDQAEKLSKLLQAFVPSLKHVVTAADLLTAGPLETPYKAEGKNFAFIQYTSGSTSHPKGVLLSHDNLLANIRAYGKAIKVSSSDVAVSWLPLYHDMGLIGMWLGSLYFGVPLVLMTPFSFLNHPEKWLWAIHYHRGTLSGAPNFAYELCVRKIEQQTIEGLDLSSWRMAANGAEKIYPKTLSAFAEKFAPYGFNRQALLPVYGLAESTVALTFPPLDRDYRLDYIARKPFEEQRKALPTDDLNALVFVSCGFPIEGHEVRILDDEDNVLPERSVGNLVFRGPSSMQGYYNNPQATEAIYREGWFHSGDLAYMAEGEIFITGRRKDLIIKAGRNLYPVEIEELVGAIPSIRQGSVVAFGDTDKERGTERLVVVAETREKQAAKQKALIATITDTIASHLDIVPDQVVLVAPHTVPKTSSGKLQRAACKKMYVEGKLGKFHLPPWLQITKLGTTWMGQKLVSYVKRLAKGLYTAYIASIFLVTFLPLYLIVYFGSRDVAAKTCKVWAKFMQLLSFCTLQIEGEENLNKDKPVIFVANHASYLDVIVMLILLPFETRFIGKKELLSTPLLATFMRKLNYLSVDRLDLTKGLQDTQRIEQVLQQNYPILIFPEGTFGYASGLRPFRLGAFKISTETHIPICPIALAGTRFILREDEKLMQPGKIKVTVCPAIKPEGEEWQAVTQLRDKVRSEIAKYCGEPSLDFIAAETVAEKIDPLNRT